jgi:hypothetical protein
MSVRIPSEVWRNSHLSIARHYGGVKLQGEMWVIDVRDDSLIRETDLKRELNEEKRMKRAENAVKREEEANLQGRLL